MQIKVLKNSYSIALHISSFYKLRKVKTTENHYYQNEEGLII
jgi:hypothetical protein